MPTFILVMLLLNPFAFVLDHAPRNYVEKVDITFTAKTARHTEMDHIKLEAISLSNAKGVLKMMMKDYDVDVLVIKSWSVAVKRNEVQNQVWYNYSVTWKMIGYKLPSPSAIA